MPHDQSRLIHIHRFDRKESSFEILISLKICYVSLKIYSFGGFDEIREECGWFQDLRSGISLISTLIKNRVGDDGMPALPQYRPSDLYLTERKETMAILQKGTHTPLHVCK